jgi:choice-of-anchor A domain-containing protein
MYKISRSNATTPSFFMKNTNRLLGSVGIVALVLALGSHTARAGFSLGDAGNFAVLFEGAGNNHLSFNNGTISGNIGIGDPSGATTAQLQLSGGAANTIIDGNVLFGGATNVAGTAGTDYTITSGHTITGNNANVQADLNYLNTLSSTLGAEAGTSLAISIANGATQTVNISSGTLDGSGDRVFTLSSVSFVNGSTLVINGDGAGDSVVFNINFGVSFGGTILLGGGLTSDQVLFNIIGANTLTISTNGAIETGTFLDPGGTIQINHSVLDGRLFGGDSHDEAIVSGAFITAPVPEPGSVALLALGFLGFFGLAAWRRRHQRQI